MYSQSILTTKTGNIISKMDQSLQHSVALPANRNGNIHIFIHMQFTTA